MINIISERRKRLEELNKKLYEYNLMSKWLVARVNLKGFKVCRSEASLFLNDRRRGEKAIEFLSVAEEVIAEYENKFLKESENEAVVCGE